MFGQSFCFVCFSLLARPYCRLGANRSAPSVFFDWAGYSTQAHTRTRAKTERIRKRGAPPIRHTHPQASQAHTEPFSTQSLAAGKSKSRAHSRSRQIKPCAHSQSSADTHARARKQKAQTQPANELKRETRDLDLRARGKKTRQWTSHPLSRVPSPSTQP